MKRIDPKSKYFPLLCLGCLGVLLASIGLTFAAYTSVDSIRRVLSTRQSVQVLSFYSNHMVSYPVDKENEITVKLISFTDRTNSQIGVTVCNYPPTNPSRINKKDIRYKFQLILEDEQGTRLNSDSNRIIVPGTSVTAGDLMKQYAVQKVGDGQSYSFENAGEVVFSNEELTGGTASLNKYVITIPGNYLEYVRIRVQAIPLDEASREATSQTSLGRILVPTLLQSQGANWTGNFTDENVTSHDKFPKLYGINYAVSGVGEGVVTITWNVAYLKISPKFLSEYQDIITVKENSIDLQVGGSNQVDYFAIPFYRVQPAPSTEGWNQNAGAGGSIVPDKNSQEGAYISYVFTAKQE